MIRNKIHVFVFLFTVAYLAIAPGVIAGYFEKLGKPVDLDITLPSPSTKIRYYFDNNQEKIIDNQKVYQIYGWAFLLEEPDQTKYDKFIVLHSENQTYFFSYDSLERKDVQKYFYDLNLDITYSGLCGYVSGDNIRSGYYNIGFLFTEKFGQKTFYTQTDYYLHRTPNSVILITNNTSDKNDRSNGG